MNSFGIDQLHEFMFAIKYTTLFKYFFALHPDAPDSKEGGHLFITNIVAGN